MKPPRELGGARVLEGLRCYNLSLAWKDVQRKDIIPEEVRMQSPKRLPGTNVERQANGARPPSEGIRLGEPETATGSWAMTGAVTALSFHRNQPAVLEENAPG